MKKIYLPGLVLVTLLLAETSVISQPFTLLKDINLGTTGSAPSSPVYFNGNLYFIADDGVNGAELWKSNGTSLGTGIVKDIFPGTTSSQISYLTVMDGKLYFSADDGINGFELWQSDGTTAGTALFKDIMPGSGSSTPEWLIAINNTLFFSADNGVNGIELWKCDGSSGGTVMVKDINAIPGSPGNSRPNNLANLNGLLIFAAADGGPSETIPGLTGSELWKSDGTEAGTVLLKDISNINSPHFGSSSRPHDFFYNNGFLYFEANSIYGSSDQELYRTDGTTAGTILLKDIYPGVGHIDFTPGYGRSSFPTYLTPFNSSIYFSANDGAHGREIWKTDGTAAGTELVKDIWTGGVPNSIPIPEWSFDGYSSDPEFLCKMGGSMYFASSEPVGGRELWKSDGTDAGTVLFKDIVAGTGSGSPANLAVINNKLYFSADDGITGRELWSSDGSPAGTTLLQDFEPAGGSDPSVFAEGNGKIFLLVTTVANGTELWVANAPQNIPLPLTLLEFKGAIQNDNGVIQWKTDNELNTKSFSVERSTDGRHFSAVGNVNAANMSGVQNYNYTDANIKSLGSSLIYYRLRQVDADNKFTYSRIVALTLDKQKSFAMLYPNPARNDINLTITLAKKDKINWFLTDNNGRVVKNGYYELGAGSSALVINGERLSAGIYLLRLNGELLQQTIKIIKQ